MDYKRSGNRIVVRLDEDDEVIESVKEVCRKENVGAAFLRGIGALKTVELSHFDSTTNEYSTRSFEGMFEITSMNGNVALSEGKMMVHIHINLGRTDLTVFGGHLLKGVVNPTCEMLIAPLDIEMTRETDEKTGLKLLRFR
jgi:predicted DNA-binding protein with PD1-like motif